MPFNRPTLAEIISRVSADYLSKISNASTFLRRSILKVLAKAQSGVVHLVYEYLQYISKQIFASTADKLNLDRHGLEFGLTRNAGTAAVGVGTASGTNGIVITAGSELQSASGNKYTVDSDVTIASGVATISFTASVVGAGYNEDGGVELTFVSPISGANTSVTVSSTGIINGVDEETDDEFREKVLNRKRKPPHGGIANDYINWCREVSGVTRAWVIPHYQGAGSVGVAFVRDDDSDLLPSDSEVATVRSYIESHTDPETGKVVGAPVTSLLGLTMIDLQKKSVDFTIKVEPFTEAIQSSITDRLTTLIRTDGGPGKTIHISRIYEAISLAVGEENSELISPTVDDTASTNEVHVLGTPTITAR